MAADELSANNASEEASEAHKLAERGLHEQAVGNSGSVAKLGAAEKELWPDPNQAAIPNRSATKAA